LVNIIASLDTKLPQQQAVALALEQYLVDFKMMVVGIEDANVGLIHALGSLCYRDQHSFEKLGIRMMWTGPLRDFRGERAKQVLCTSQECLLNTMHYANVSLIEVICRYVIESDSLLLEVRDNDRRLAIREVGRPRGKGLESMSLRAQKMGCHLKIFIKPQRASVFSSWSVNTHK
jgi:signal transduction histidine kinase